MPTRETFHPSPFQLSPIAAEPGYSCGLYSRKLNCLTRRTGALRGILPFFWTLGFCFNLWIAFIITNGIKKNTFFHHLEKKDTADAITHKHMK